MRDMNFDEIKRKLLGAGYPDNPVTDRTAERLLSLSGKASDMLNDWISEGIIPSFNPINGVGSDFLRNKLKMKAPALAIAYSMLEEDPEGNASYFRKLADNIIGYYPNFTE